MTAVNSIIHEQIVVIACVESLIEAESVESGRGISASFFCEAQFLSAIKEEIIPDKNDEAQRDT